MKCKRTVLPLLGTAFEPGRLADTLNEFEDEELAEIAGQNMESTQRTFEETQKVTDTFKEVYSGAVKLREIADKLAESVSYFKM